MPQVESLVCGVTCGDPKVACEPTVTGSQPDLDENFPPESITIPITSDLDWSFDLINPIYDRDDSTKGTTNPKSHQNPQTQNQNQNQNHSKRFSGNLKPTAKAPIIALPNKIQHHSGYLGQSTRRPRNIFPFPKRGVVKVSDPGSPKVSCFGKVSSERRGSTDTEDGGGCWASVAALFRCGRGRGAAAGEGDLGPERNIPERERTAEAAPVAEPPGIGGMKRFVSGRRSASWGGDVEAESEMDGHVAWSGPLDRR